MKSGAVRVAAVLLLACAIGVAAKGARADEQRTLPAFTLVAPTGNSVASTQLSSDARPLLVYVTPECRPCDRLIAALIEWQPTMPANRLVLIIGASADAARTYAEERQLGAAAGIAWYADPLQSGASAIGVLRVPSLVAVENGRIQWVISGVLNDPGALEATVRSWTSR